jgi:hypothetical protein
MILLYPVGIPSLYLYLLYCSKEEIIQRHQEEETVTSAEDQPKLDKGRSVSMKFTESIDSRDAVAKQVDEELAMRNSMGNPSETTIADAKPVEMSDATQRLSFLWQAYEPKFWYWEVIETTRKLMLTAVLSVCNPGSSEQSVLGVLMSYAYIRLYSYYRPYEEDAENVLAETGQMQILFTFFVTLVFQNSLLNAKWNYGLGVILTLINLTIIVLTLYYEVKNYQDTVEATREKDRLAREVLKKKLMQKRLEFAYRAGQNHNNEGGFAGQGGVTGGSGGMVQFKKKNVEEIQFKESISEPSFSESSLSVSQVMSMNDDSDDEDDNAPSMVKNVLHGSKPNNVQQQKTIELKAFKPTASQSLQRPASSIRGLNPPTLVSASQVQPQKKSPQIEIDSDDED